MLEKFFKKSAKEKAKDTYAFAQGGTTRDSLLSTIQAAQQEAEPLRSVKLNMLYSKIVSFNNRTRVLGIAPIDPECSLEVSAAIEKIWNLIADLKITKPEEVAIFALNAFRKDGPYKDFSDAERERARKTILECKGISESDFDW